MAKGTGDGAAPRPPGRAGQGDRLGRPWGRHPHAGRAGGDLATVPCLVFPTRWNRSHLRRSDSTPRRAPRESKLLSTWKRVQTLVTHEAPDDTVRTPEVDEGTSGPLSRGPLGCENRRSNTAWSVQSDRRRSRRARATTRSVQRGAWLHQERTRAALGEWRAGTRAGPGVSDGAHPGPGGGGGPQLWTWQDPNCILSRRSVAHKLGPDGGH